MKLFNRRTTNRKRCDCISAKYMRVTREQGIHRQIDHIEGIMWNLCKRNFVTIKV